MNFTTRNLLISSLGAFMVCLIASTVTPVVFAEESNVEKPYWGNLKVGDEMCWQWQCPSPMTLYTSADYKLEILEVRRDRLKVEYHSYLYNYNDPQIDKEERGIATLSSVKLWPFIYPVALLQENEDVKIQTYEYKGSTYIAAYLGVNATEYWWDYGTGILFQEGFFMGDYLFIEWGLWHTNADLAPSVTVPEKEDPLLLFLKGNWIALVAVAHVVVVLLVVFLVSVVTSVGLICLQVTRKRKIHKPND